MKVGLMKKFHCFTLKQGTAFIAVCQLFVSVFGMIFLVLALAHAMVIQEMVVRDTEDALAREALEDISSNHLNTKKMDMAHHNATEMVYAIYCGLVVIVIHFISSILLLYGALTNNRHFMAPWLMVTMTIISAFTISLFLVEQDCPFIATLGGKAGIYERMFILWLIFSSSYVWFVVYSAYKSLETKKGLTHILHGVKKKTPPISSKSPVPVIQISKAVQTCANKPSEV
ncbi:uncharacterized protein LOC128887207 [Hylaeus anthracinus]|uniref:uncharacterized protein LOC128878029 n=1 Tax=Hylaeus volcanicus TaxID=313075 RepID=UPI0023B7FD5F|nr:uncharacterized protein LOC128878029 [Hylaeus volcanicus]XP_053998820.1 uncharacterized protein LOC128887207 [Hylaeus anthracinus]